jgi:uncharacterized protein YcnI
LSHKQLFKRAGFLSGAVVLTGLLSAGVASAHVTANVYGAQPTKGGYGAIFFRVPNEEANASTTKVEIDFKPEYAIGSVRTQAVPGWTAEVTKTKLPAPVKTASGTEITEVITKVSWTAQPGGGIADTTQFQEFEISAGALPNNVDELVLPAVQTYSDGKVVNWSELTPAGGEEPEHPAPTVALAAATSGDGDHASVAGAATDGGHTEAASSGSDTTARWLGGAGLVVGALGLGVGAGATLRARRSGAAKTPVNATESTE